MTNYVLTWTEPAGEARSSAVAYDKPSAARRKQDLEDAGCRNVQIIETRPGQRPEAAA
ncbi:hypothetical protein [Streptomyces melanogenes]|uniref:hypothetical protein n=1 Tax=Streptomyces melanogenes TaxID=67326 RepID=UPI00167E7C91|nr:hypothetical protein [Streptomyces melanogenes]